LINIIRSHHFGAGIRLEGTSRSDKALTEIAIIIRELEHGYTGLKPVLLACDPLLGTTTGSQHQYKRDRNSDVETRIADYAQPHETNLPLNPVQAYSLPILAGLHPGIALW
jgi:hypothetical protein